MKNELEALAVGVHATASTIHARGVAVGRLSGREQGAATALHLLGIAHHAINGNLIDVIAHVAAIGATYSSSRLAHLVALGYDARATWRHMKRI